MERACDGPRPQEAGSGRMELGQQSGCSFCERLEWLLSGQAGSEAQAAQRVRGGDARPRVAVPAVRRHPCQPPALHVTGTPAQVPW